ncbi:gamma-glutamyltransferase [Mesorhizobium sp. AA22]|uniref:gamma-glutamyltransferase n=1 Tax=Mesorhizobium sp. AA22 TaxID=1854057 RepID=UPI0032B2AA40
MLNILENFDAKSIDPIGPDRFHLVLEAARIGYAVRDTHLSDADHMRTPIAALTDKAWGKKLASLIDMNKRSALPAAPTPVAIRSISRWWTRTALRCRLSTRCTPASAAASVPTNRACC